MNTILEAINGAGLKFVEFALPMLIQSSLLILILLAADFLLRKRVRAVFRYWIWMLVLIKLMLPSSLYSPLSLGSWFGEKIEFTQQDNIEDTGQTMYKSENIHEHTPAMPDFRSREPMGENSRALSINHESGTISNPAAANPIPAASETIEKDTVITQAAATKISWQAEVFLMWIAIAAILALIVLKRTIFIRELVKNAADIDFSNNNSILPKTGRVGFYPTNYSTLQFGPASTTLQYCCKCLSFKKQIPLKISPDATSPVVCGLLRPVILLPQNLISSLSQEQLKAIFFHELAHIRRLDLWVNLLQTLLQVIYFYNPLFWLANSIIRRTREQAVDEMVLVTMGKNAAEYPETLVSVAKLAFKRPALSLRLIGVVESEDALSGRIKHMLNHPIPKTAKLGLLGLLIIIILASILLPMTKMAKPKMSVINNGPLDIKLVAIRPDSGDMLYDPNGRKIGKLPEFAVAYQDSWNPESQCRDFIFELPKDQNQLLFAAHGIYITDNYLSLGDSFREIYNTISDPPTLTYSVSFERSYRKYLVPFFSVNHVIDYIDITLNYYYGPRKEALSTFSGPFTLDRTITADGNSPYYVTFKESDNTINNGLEINFQSNQFIYFSKIPDIIIYDLNGKRYFMDNPRSGSVGFIYSDIPVSLDKIAAVTFGEQSYRITFKNVKVQYNTPPRTHAEYLDIMAQRLNLAGLTSEELRRYDFKNPQEAIKVIDIIQSQSHIRQAVQAIRFNQYNSGSPAQDQDAMRNNPKVRIPELNKETQIIIRKVAAQWASSSDVENFGLELGLMGKWPEFFDMAIERLSKEPPEHLSPEKERIWRQDNHEITNVMLNYRLDKYTTEQADKLKQLILSTNDKAVLQDIFNLLKMTKIQEITDVLWELAQDENPWIWWRAFEAWYYHISSKDRNIDDLSEENKLKLFLIHGFPKDDNLDKKATERLAEIFTPELGRLDAGTWNSVKTKITQKYDKKEATELFINYLRQVHDETTARQWKQRNAQPVWNVINIIWNLNLWYDVNIGNIGIEEPGRGANIEPRTFAAFQTLISQALNWYDENQNVEPIELAFAGKVVDTSGNPIVNAKLIFTKMEDYQDERGYKNQRRVEVSQITTDMNGQFSVVLDSKEQWYELNVTADGFLTRERIMVHPLDDGRFRYNDRYTDKDNVITMQHPGRISGTVYGSDGKPLLNTKFKLWANYQYSSTGPELTITTDSQGKFDVNGIAADPMLLSYTRLNQVPQGRTSRQEYGGLCGALIIENKEGQNLSDIVLDLSKSVCSLELEVKDKAGVPVDSINMYFDIKMPPGSGYLYNTVFYSKEEKSDGIYKFEGLPPGKWHLRISNSDYPDQELDVELTGEKPAHHQIEIGSSADSEIKKRAELERALRAAKETLPKNLSDVPFMDNQFTSNNKEPISNQTSVLQGTPIIGYDVKLNFTEPNISDGSFHSEQSVAFALSFLQIQDRPGYYVDFISTGQETWPVIVDDNTLTISNGNSGRQIISESWTSEETKFEKVITLPLEYSGKKFQCPVYIELQRREHNSPIGYYWFCAYISGRLPRGASSRIFEIVNLDQQMEFRLKGDGTDKRDAVLGIDIDGDGKIDSSTRGGEQFSLYEPFTIDSKTYRVTEVDPYLPRVVFREVASETKTNTSASGQSVKPKLTIKSHEANGANKEAEALMGKFQQALKDSDFEKAISLCSQKVQSFAKKYQPLEDFFNDVVPIEKIKALSEVLTFGGSTGPGNRRLAYFCCVQLSEPDIKPQISWEWKLNNTDSGWEIDFKTLTLNAWIEQETNRLNNERIQALERDRILKEGLELKLVPLSESFVVGKPMEFRLELTNISDSPIEYWTADFYLLNDPLTIIDPNGKHVEYMSGSTQTTTVSKTLNPNQTIILKEKYDVTSQYHITKPGTYTFQFTGYDSTVVKSNIVKVEVNPGQISDDDLIFQKLIDIAPEDWEITKTRIRDLDDFNIEDNNGISIAMIGDYDKETTEGFAGVILLINTSQSYLEAIDNEAEFLGHSRWGNVYINSLNAESLWPDYKEQIVKVLRIETAENSIKQNEEKAKWGDVVEGSQIRLVDANQIWGRSDWPHAVVRLHLEAKNNGQRYLHLPENGLRWQIEVDGKWYEYVKYEQGPDGIDFGAGTVLRDFNQGNFYDDLKVEIAGNWKQIPQEKEIEYAMRQYSGSGGIIEVLYGKELILESGKHKIRTAITCPPSKRVNIVDSPVRLISNPIEVTLDKVPDDNEVPWGQTIEEIQIRGRMDEQWHEGEVPKFLVDVRNNGPEDLRLVLAPEWWELELDGIWYKIGAWYSGIVPVMSLDSGEQKNGIEFVPTERWEWNNNRDPLKFTEGTHEVRLSLTVFRKDPNDKRSTRVLSNQIEFEILPKEENSDANASGAGQTGVNIYLLDGASAQPLSESVLRDKPWIASEDIEMYDFSSHCIYLKKERPELPFKTVSLRGNPFVITANGQKCYSGLLWTSVSSFMPEWNTPLIYVPDFTMPGDIINIQLSPGLSSSEEDTQTQDVRIDPHIIQALKEKGQYHAGLEITLDKVDIRKTDTGSSLSYTYTLKNNDQNDLYVFDPNKMGAGLFHYFNNCPSLLPEGGGRYIAGDNDKIVKTPDPSDKIDKSWFSLIESGQSMTRTVTLDAYPEISQGKYECSFRFHSPGIRFTKDQRAQFDKRVWMGQISAKTNVNITGIKAQPSEVEANANKLEFRIIPEAPGSSGYPIGFTPQEVQQFIQVLEQNGPNATVHNNDYIWLELDESVESNLFIKQKYQGKMYVLASNRKSEIMLDDGSWYMNRANRNREDNFTNRYYSVSSRLDEYGDHLLSSLTNNNMGKYLAVIANGKIIFASRISRIMHEVTITGDFSAAQAGSWMYRLDQFAQVSVLERKPRLCDVDRQASQEYDKAREAIAAGENRAKLAQIFLTIGAKHPKTDECKTATELGHLLEKMAQEDKNFVEPKDVQKLSSQEKIDYYIYKLRDISKQSIFTGEKIHVLREADNSAVTLREMGKDVVPAMISLLEDRRPTRTASDPFTGGVILRYCDIALEIIESISGKKFDFRTVRGSYLSTASEKLREKIIEDVKSWWEQNKDKSDKQPDSMKNR
ncbi:MAG: M48 family metalloprotease [Sedimentisphaerales bacterium]|nr:M48 family metalloprotease [Sedimentisphaerales bacterium]